MFAIGNDELKSKDNICKTVTCNICGKEHDVQYGKVKNEQGEWVESKMLAFINCGEESYLVGVNGKDIRDRF